jgi:hypothetical protein
MTFRFLLSLRKRIAPLGILAASLLALAPQAEAQCFTHDGLDATACCSPVTPNLPTFPNASLPGKGICWTDCTIAGEECTKIALSTPVPNPAMCTQYASQIDVFNCTTGAQLMKGNMTMDYTRTWSEQVGTSSMLLQIWRFAVKVDMVSPAGAPAGCPTPLCAQVPGASAFYYGYVDYSYDCVTNVYDTVLVLYHGCDEFTHRPGLSGVPGTFHPNSTYAIVAPDTASNPFVVTNAPPTAGIVVNEAMRRVTPDATGICHAEEHIQQGAFQPLVNGCLCPLGSAPNQQTGVRVNGSGMCGGGFGSLNLWPVAPWYELVVTSIGRWTNASSYPGPEHASVAEGLFGYNDPCPTTGISEVTYDIFYGGFTQFGSSVVSTSPIFPPLSQRFLDLASNYSLLTTLPISFPLFGSVRPTDHLIYLNP